jgi:hypothetical protein
VLIPTNNIFIYKRAKYITKIRLLYEKMFFALLALVIAIPLASTGNTEHWSVGSVILPDPTVHFRLDIYSPTTPGSYPVLVFLPGLAGLVSATYYTTLVTTIAEQNVILVGISKLEDIKPEKVAVHIGELLDWAVTPNDGIARLFAEHKAVEGVTPNLDRLGFLSHSSAAHPLGQYLNTTCGSLKLVIMMNPVDGIDPFGIIQDFITRREKEKYLFVLYYLLFLC